MNSKDAAPAVTITPPLVAEAKPDYTALWNERISPFANAVGKTVEEITEALAGVVGVPSEDALNILSDKEAAPDSDILTALTALKIPSGKFRLHVAKLRGAPKVAAAATNVAGPAMQALAILPQVPDTTSFIEMLKVGGVLKIGVAEVLSAVKAALARRVGLFDLPDRLLEKMEAFAQSQDEPCGEEFFKLQRLITEKRYGEVLSALGVAGSFVSPRRKKEFFDRLDAKLWKALHSFNTQLAAWQRTWMETAANPGMLMLAMAGGSAGMALPPGVMQAPDTTALRAAAESVVDDINRVFAGPGIPVARALAYDATRIMKILEEPTLPVQVGSANKDQMLKDLGITVGAEIVRTEQNITRFALAIMSLPKVAADAELAYLAAMLQLGSTIPWDKLETLSVSIPGRGRSAAGLGRTEEDE